MSLDFYLECPCCGTTVFSSNITHNLNKMADAAGIYTALWRPEEIGARVASDLIVPLSDGIDLLETDPSRFERLNAANGWGTYEQFLPWVREVLSACVRNPQARVRVSR